MAIPKSLIRWYAKAPGVIAAPPGVFEILAVKPYVAPPAPPLIVSASVTPETAETEKEVTFSALVSGGTPPYTVNWTRDITGFDYTIPWTFEVPGWKYATVEVIDAEGKRKTATTRIKITEKPAVIIPRIKEFFVTGADRTTMEAFRTFYRNPQPGLIPIARIYLPLYNQLLDLEIYPEERATWVRRVEGLMAEAELTAREATEPSLRKFISHMADIFGIPIPTF